MSGALSVGRESRAVVDQGEAIARTISELEHRRRNLSGGR